MARTIEERQFRVLVSRAADRNAPGARAASGKLWRLIAPLADQHLRCVVTDFDTLPRGAQDELRDQLLALVVEHVLADPSLTSEHAILAATYYVYRVSRIGS